MNEYVILSPEWVWIFDTSTRDRGVKELRGDAAVAFVAALPQEGGVGL